MTDRLKAWIASGAAVPAAWLELGSPDVAELFARAGWPALVIDNEHGAAAGDLGVAVHMQRAAQTAGAETILRAPSADPTYLKLALDRGFRAIMAPMINSAEEARAFVAACRYPPQGRRGYAAAAVRASGFGAEPDYGARANDGLFLIAQIETPEAVADAAAIAAVDGVDMVFIGPNDLAGAMGFFEEMTAPAVVSALDALEDDLRRRGALMGTVLRPGHDAASLAARGHRLLVGPVDVVMLAGGARSAAADWRAALDFAADGTDGA